MSDVSAFEVNQHQLPAIMTYGGEARSGKGTSVAAVQTRLEEHGVQHRVIDQGLKFRILADMALTQRMPLDDETELSDFIEAEDTHLSLLRLLDETAGMTPEDVKSWLYTSALSVASGQIGRVPSSHTVAVELLRAEVIEAKERGDRVILIDGRAMDKYGQQFTQEGIGRFILGYYFRCDAVIAATRSLGLFVDHENMSADEKLHLLAEIMRISSRNRSDAMRPVDPMREPTRAFDLDLHNFYNRDIIGTTPYGQAQKSLGIGMVKLDTSYTRNVEEMVRPVVDLSSYALVFRAGLDHSFARTEVADS